MKRFLFLVLAVLMIGCIHTSVYKHVYIGKRVYNYRPGKNFGRIGIIHSVHKDHWGNCSWALIHYDGSPAGSLSGEELPYLYEVKK